MLDLGEKDLKNVLKGNGVVKKVYGGISRGK